MTSKYINKNYFSSVAEHNLLDALTAESVKVTGFEVYYIPQEFTKDPILFEADIASYPNAYKLDVNLENNTGWDGNIDVMSKFGLMNDNRATFKCSIKTFKDLKIPGRLDRPFSGDLIYVPFSTNYQEITSVEDEASNFYGMGKLSTYTLITEVYKFNHEEITTGIEEIDQITSRYSEEVQHDTLAQNNDFKTAAVSIRDTANDIFNGL